MLLIFGLGYSGKAVASLAQASGFAVQGTVRDPTSGDAIGFDQASAPLAAATHLLSSVPPDPSGDPVLARYGAQIAAAPRLRWIGYLSSTVVYGDRDGGWVDEDTPPAPTQARGHRRLAAEQAWSRFADRCAVDIFRLAGIYGPGRSVLEELRAGRARRIAKAGHAFGRIHRDDIARAVLAAMQQERPPGTRILNLNDDEPAEIERGDRRGRTPARRPAAARNSVRAGLARHEPDGAQLLGGEPQGGQPQDPGARWESPGAIRPTAKAYAPSCASSERDGPA